MEHAPKIAVVDDVLCANKLHLEPARPLIKICKSSATLKTRAAAVNILSKTWQAFPVNLNGLVLIACWHSPVFQGQTGLAYKHSKIGSVLAVGEMSQLGANEHSSHPTEQPPAAQATAHQTSTRESKQALTRNYWRPIELKPGAAFIIGVAEFPADPRLVDLVNPVFHLLRRQPDRAPNSPCSMHSCDNACWWLSARPIRAMKL